MLTERQVVVCNFDLVTSQSTSHSHRLYNFSSSLRSRCRFSFLSVYFQFSSVMYSRFRSAVVKARAHSANTSGMSGNRGRGGEPPSSPSESGTFSFENFTVDHDTKRKEFFIKMGGDKAFIQYNKLGEVMHLEHTEVPDAFSGRGVGKILAKVWF